MRVPVLFTFLLLFLLAGCGQIGAVSDESTLDSGGQNGIWTEAQVIDTVWSSLEPNTLSHKRDHWDVEEIRQVEGNDVAEEFMGEAAAGCWMGPTPVPNRAISGDRTYWYVSMTPKRATPVPLERTVSPTEPPAVPEPFLYRALFLLESESGQVVARKLFCVIY